MSELDVQALRPKAHAGDPAAQYALGRHMLCGLTQPFDPDGGASLVERAAEQDYPPAIHLCGVLSAAGFCRPLDWKEAFRLVRRAADKGDHLAQGAMALLGDDFDVGAWLEPPPTVEVRIRPHIQTFPSFIPRAWCEWLIELARPSLVQAGVYTNEGYRPNKARTNSVAGIGVALSDIILQLTNARIAAAIHLPLVQQEPANVLHYLPGQEFKLHPDYLDPRVASAAEEIKHLGQRLVTFLIYLNDDYEGGETDFPRLGWRFRGKAGDALMFWNVGPNGAPDPSTYHAGLTPMSGEKWLLSKWVRDRPLRLR